MVKTGLGAKLADLIGALGESTIRLWVRLTGKKIRAEDAPWLDSPIGPPGLIGKEIYTRLAEKEGLELRATNQAGLLTSFQALSGPHFDPSRIHPAIATFYERTAGYRMDVWSEAGLIGRFFLWALVRFVSRRMNQLNVPVSSLELAGGMKSEVLEPIDPTSGQRVHVGWLRKMALTDKVIYAGLYSVSQVPGDPNPCVKVSFPLPKGCVIGFLKPAALADGSFTLSSAGRRFGETGFYRMVETSPGKWRVRYLRALREHFHVYVDPEEVLRTDHTIHFMGIKVLHLHYKILPIAESASVSG